MKVNKIFTYLGYTCVLIYIFTTNTEIFRVSMICFFIALTLDNIKPTEKEGQKKDNYDAKAHSEMIP